MVDNNTPNNEEVKFNAGLDTLKFMSEIQREMKKIKVEGGTHGKFQHALIGELQQYFYASCVLIKNNEMYIKYKTRLDLIKPLFETNNKNGGRMETKEIYSYDIDAEIWNFFADLRNDLQKTGLFMPTKKETMF